jgi:hypothetical protein
LLGPGIAVIVFALASPAAAAGHDFTICGDERAATDSDAPHDVGRFALCAASTCTQTGRKITVNVTAGGTAQFPEYDCTCPVLRGPSIADLNGGNMQGSCQPPSRTQVWSLYAPRLHIPQALTDWKRGASATRAPLLQCQASLNLGDQLVNCFSFACDLAGTISGVPVATCHCALGESLDGVSVPANTAFLTQAGQGNTAICAQHPVAAPFP